MVVSTREASARLGRSTKSLLALIRKLNAEAAVNPDAPAVICLRGRVDYSTLQDALKAKARRDGGMPNDNIQ